MNESWTVLVFVIVVGLVAALVTISARFAAYRSRFVFTKEQLDKARKDSVKGSQLTRNGQAAEHLAPFLPGLFEAFNPKDARFMGDPIDFVIFDGLDEGEIRSVVLVEIKTGRRGDLNKRQRQVKRAIERKDVDFRVVTPGINGQEVFGSPSVRDR